MRNPDLLTFGVACKRYGLTPQWLRAEVDAGRIASVKTGRHGAEFFSASAIEAAILDRVDAGRALVRAKIDELAEVAAAFYCAPLDLVRERAAATVGSAALDAARLLGCAVEDVPHDVVVKIVDRAITNFREGRAPTPARSRG